MGESLALNDLKGLGNPGKRLLKEHNLINTLK
jgi:hypothetical protein